MLTMNNKDEKIVHLLNQIGDRLREARLARNESQEIFAARIGISRQSYSKMEKGSASVPIGKWLSASDILNRLDTWQEVLAEKTNLFEEFERKQLTRQRAGSKKSGKQ